MNSSGDKDIKRKDVSLLLFSDKRKMYMWTVILLFCTMIVLFAINALMPPVPDVDGVDKTGGFYQKNLNIKCKNTAQGRHFVTDDLGFVCKREDVLESGCCKTSSSQDTPISTEKYSCSSCDLTSACCHHFEYCVSCCMKSDYKFLKKQRSIDPLLKTLDFDEPVSRFDICRAACRTSSKSVINQNKFLNEDLKYCYPSDGTGAGLKLSPRQLEEQNIDEDIINEDQKQQTETEQQKLQHENELSKEQEEVQDEQKSNEVETTKENIEGGDQESNNQNDKEGIINDDLNETKQNKSKEIEKEQINQEPRVGKNGAISFIDDVERIIFKTTSASTTKQAVAPITLIYLSFFTFSLISVVAKLFA